MWFCYRALRLITLANALSSLIYVLSLLLPINLCTDIFCLKINALIAFVFLSLTLDNFIAENKTPFAS